MAFDLAVGKTQFIRHNPIILASIEFDQLPLINSLYKKYNGTLLRNLCNHYENFTMQGTTLEESREQLYQVIEKSDLIESERAFIYQLIAIASYALDRNLPLHGITD